MKPQAYGSAAGVIARKGPLTIRRMRDEQEECAYEKAGFRRMASVLDTDTRHGQRVESWLMVRQRDS